MWGSNSAGSEKPIVYEEKKERMECADGVGPDTRCPSKVLKFWQNILYYFNVPKNYSTIRL